MSRDVSHVERVIEGLRDYYADKDGNKRVLNATQIAVYLDGLGRYPPDVLELAARQWMRQSRFFPALSDLLGLIEPDPTEAAHFAWAAVEKAIREGGVYRSVRFEQGAIGEAVRQTFGSWPRACSFEYDSPGWAIRRQTFMAVFPSLLKRDIPPVTLRGLAEREEVHHVGLVQGVPELRQIGVGDEPLTQRESRVLLAEIQSRYLAQKNKS